MTTDMLAVVSEGGATVSLLDASDHHVRAVIDVAAEPHELCFDPEHRLLYVTSTYYGGYYDANLGRNHLITVIDPDAGAVVDVVDIAPEHGPHGLALDPVRRLLYVSVEAGPAGTGGVLVLDTTTRRVLHRIDTLAPGPHWFTLDPTGDRGYVANKEAPFVTVIEPASGAVVDKVAVPGSEGIAAAPDGSTVAVAAPKAGSGRDRPGIRLIDPSSREITRVLPTDRDLRPVHWTSTGLLLAGEMGGTLQIWAGPVGAAVEPVGRAVVGDDPLTITSSPDGTRAYVAAVTDSTVTAVDLADPARPAVADVVAIPAARGTGAHGMAYIAGTPGPR